MTISADGDNLVLGRGALFIDQYVSGAPTGGLRFVGNVSELRLTTTDDVREKYSSSESASPLLKRVVARRTIELVATLDEFQLENLALALMGSISSTTQSTTAVTAQAITAVQQGQYYDIGKRNVSSFTAEPDGGGTAYVLDTDYTIDLVSGLLYIIPGGGIADDTDIQVNYTPAATVVKTINGGGTSIIEAYVHFESDNASGPNYRLKAWKCSINPDGDLGFISDDFGTFNLRMAVQNDGVNHPTTPNYVLEKVA